MGIFRKNTTDNQFDEEQPVKHFGLLHRKSKTAEVPEEKIKETPPQPEMEEIYSTKDKQIRYKNEMPIESEKIRHMQETRKKSLISGDGEIKLKEREQIDNIELTVDDRDVDVIKEVIGSSFSFQSVHTVKSENSEIFDTGELAKLPAVASRNKVHTIPPYEHESKIDHIKIKAGRFTQVVESEYDQYLIKNNPTVSKRQQIQNHVPENKSLIYHLNQVATKYRDESKNEEERERKQREIIRERRRTQQGDSEEDLEKRTQTAEKPLQSLKKEQKEQKEPLDVSVVGKRKKKVKPPAPKKEVPEDEIVRDDKEKESVFSKIGHFFNVIIAIIASAFISPKPKDRRRIPRSTRGDDFDQRQDARYVMSQIKSNVFTLIITLVLLIAIFVFFFVISVIESRDGSGMLSEYTSFGPIIYAGINFILLILSGIVYRKYLVKGFSSLRYFRPSVDAMVALSFIACLIQSITAFIVPSRFMGGDFHIYSILVVGAMLMFTVGRLFIELRVRSNFKFIISKSPAYVVKTYGDEEASMKMLSGTTASKHNLTYQHRTEFLSDFLKISYAPDPSEEICSRLAPVMLVTSLLVSVIYGIISKDVVAALSTFAVMCCVGLPFSSIIAGNIPLYLFSKRSLKNNAMVNGFPCIRQFCDSSALMLRAGDLYPAGSVKLERINDFTGQGIDNILLSCGVLLREVYSPLSHVFDEIVRENNNRLPRVESYLYEDRMGVVGWVSGNRILIGNRKLMEKYHIIIDQGTNDLRLKKKGLDVTYIAYGGTFAAEVISRYKPNLYIQKDLFKAEERGLSFIISSSDPNLDAEKIAEDYNLYPKSVKVMTLGYANTCNDLMDKKTLTSRSYLATRGRFSSYCKAVSGCKKLKSNLTLGLIVQIFGLALGVLLCATMALYAGVARLNVFNLLLFILFWVLATQIAELIRRP